MSYIKTLEPGIYVVPDGCRIEAGVISVRVVPKPVKEGK